MSNMANTIVTTTHRPLQQTNNGPIRVEKPAGLKSEEEKQNDANAADTAARAAEILEAKMLHDQMVKEQQTILGPTRHSEKQDETKTPRADSSEADDSKAPRPATTPEGPLRQVPVCPLVEQPCRDRACSDRGGSVFVPPCAAESLPCCRTAFLAAVVAPHSANDTIVMADQHNGMPTKYEIVSVREKHGAFRKAVPLLPLPVALLLCCLNLILPGIGTLLAGLSVLCGCPTEYESRWKAFLYNLVASILQLVTSPFVVGWVWSIMWGITFVSVSISKDVIEPVSVAQV